MVSPIDSGASLALFPASFVQVFNETEVNNAERPGNTAGACFLDYYKQLYGWSISPVTIKYKCMGD